MGEPVLLFRQGQTRPMTRTGEAVLVTGEAVVDFVPDQPGPLASVEGFSRRVGGAAVNVAVALARLSHPPDLWTRVGSDPFGEFLVSSITEEGVPERLVERDPTAKTSLAFVAHDEDAKPTFVLYRDHTADTRMEIDSVAGTLDSYGWFYVGGVQLSAGKTRESTFDLLEERRPAGATVVFDPNTRPELWTEHDLQASLERALRSVDVVKTSTEDFEATAFPHEDPEELARALLAGNPHTVVVTDGAAGSSLFSSSDAPWGELTVGHGGYDVEPVDTTGAGDAFTGALLSGLRAGETGMEELLSTANAVAALSTTRRGAISALPTRGELGEFLDEQA